MKWPKVIPEGHTLDCPKCKGELKYSAHRGLEDNAQGLPQVRTARYCTRCDIIFVRIDVDEIESEKGKVWTNIWKNRSGTLKPRPVCPLCLDRDFKRRAKGSLFCRICGLEIKLIVSEKTVHPRHRFDVEVG